MTQGMTVSEHLFECLFYGTSFVQLNIHSLANLESVFISTERFGLETSLAKDIILIAQVRQKNNGITYGLI